MFQPGDAVLLVSRDAQVTWPLTCGQDKPRCCVKRLLPSLVCRLSRGKQWPLDTENYKSSERTGTFFLLSFPVTDLDFVWINKLGIGVNIVHFLISQSDPVAPVQRANVVIDRLFHGLPVVFDYADGLPINQMTFYPCDVPGGKLDPSPVSSNSQPNLRASWIAVRSRAVWCISFFGMQPTLTHVPPRPDHHKGATMNQQGKKGSVNTTALRLVEGPYPRTSLWVWAQHSPGPWPSFPIEPLPVVGKKKRR